MKKTYERYWTNPSLMRKEKEDLMAYWRTRPATKDEVFEYSEQKVANARVNISPLIDEVSKLINTLL